MAALHCHWEIFILVKHVGKQTLAFIDKNDKHNLILGVL